MPGLKNIDAKFAQIRCLKSWHMPEFVYQDLAAFESISSLQNGVHTVLAAGLPIDLYMDLKPGCPIVFFFNGAKVRTDDLKLPVFAGLRVLPPGDVSRVYLSDPSLYLERSLSLGWYAGSTHLRLQQILPRILGRIIELMRSSKVMFTGGSGGGFASLYYARLFKRSLAVVWNPQTDILKFYPRHIDEYGYAAFKFPSLEATRTLLPQFIDTNLCRLYSPAIQENFILYLQNRSDKYHIDHHLKPFLACLGKAIDGDAVFTPGRIDQRLYLHGGEWGDGHVSPPLAFLTELYGRLLNQGDGWDSLFARNRRLADIIF